MSDYRSRRSPYEQGELKGSPDRHAKKKKSSKKSKKKSHQLPPEAKPYVHKAEDDDDVQIIEAVGHGEEEGGSLTIKPPQTYIPKPEKSHKHKKDKHRVREDIGSGRDRFYNDDSGKKDKHKEYDMGRDIRDAREIVRERKKERELKEKEFAREMTKREARKREESIKERERLERMEMEERKRERQMREVHHLEKESRQLKRKEDRRYLLDNKRERGRKDRNEEYLSDDHNRSRSRDHNKSKEQSKALAPTKNYPDERVNSKKDRISDKHRTGMEKSESDQDTRRVVVDDSVDNQDKKKSKKREYNKNVMRSEGTDSYALGSKSHDSKMIRDQRQDKQRKDEEHEVEDAEEESEESDSSEDSDSSSSEEEDDDDSSEEEEDDEEEDVEEADEGSNRRDSSEIVDRTDDGRGKVRSKFDDHSDGETLEHDFDRSGSDDNYMPDSPEMSDLEESLENNLPVYLPAIQGCRSVEEFNCLNRIEEGTYGVVYRALDKKTDEIVALKRLKMEKEKEGFPITSLREINTLLKAQHENIVTVREIVVGSNMDKIYIVMDFVEHDLKSLMENMKNPFLVGEVKTLLKQLLRAVRHMHDNWILHRDLKTSNLLLSHKGILKVGDFGLAREYGSPLRNYTPIVVTLWYRAPELLLGCKQYSTLVDMWSVGCIFAEFLLMKALWPGKSEIDQINKIFKDLGTPTEKIWSGVMELPGMKKVNFNDNPYNVLRNRFGSYFTDNGFNLLNRFFAYDPTKRITADEALKHDYFGESPLPVDPSMFPTWPARSEQTKKTASSPKPPSGGKAYQDLMDDEANLAAAGGFHMGSAAKGVSAQGMGFSLRF